MSGAPTSTDGQRLHSLLGFRMVTPDLQRLTTFYRDVLGFSPEGEVQSIPPEDLRSLGLQGAGWRQVLTIGTQTIAIDQFEIAGRPYPAGSTAASLWFQHLALVVVDIAETYARLRDIVPISTEGPQRLPASSGSVQAFKFRDPDGHPLELLQFPRAAGPATWQHRSALSGQIALGIDHSAISVGDVEASTAFYAALGLKPEPGTLNTGLAQERLDDLRDVEVAVRPMTTPEGSVPHLELLGYKVPRGQAGARLQANDVAATRLIWRGRQRDLLHDPDGHLHHVQPEPAGLAERVVPKPGPGITGSGPTA